jgi:hypothetical protein
MRPMFFENGYLDWHAHSADFPGRERYSISAAVLCAGGAEKEGVAAQRRRALANSTARVRFANPQDSPGGGRHKACRPQRRL